MDTINGIHFQQCLIPDGIADMDKYEFKATNLIAEKLEKDW